MGGKKQFSGILSEIKNCSEDSMKRERERERGREREREKSDLSSDYSSFGSFVYSHKKADKGAIRDEKI